MKKLIVGTACLLLSIVGLSACGKKAPQPEEATEKPAAAEASAAKAIEEKPTCTPQGCAPGEVCRADGRCSPQAFEAVFDISGDAFVNDKTVRIALPIRDLPETVRILWGDEPPGAEWNVIATKDNPEIFHDYKEPGRYHVKILDSDVTWGYDGLDYDDESCKSKDWSPDGQEHLTEVVSFGNIRLGENAFLGTGLKKLPEKDVPDATKLKTLSYAFACTYFFNQPVNFDTSNVTDMSGMFYEAEVFDQPVNIDTSKVTDMSYMFWGAKSFNQPVNIDTSKVTDMLCMFRGAWAFNQPVNFDTKNVTNMSCMFSDATSFNQPLNFDTKNVTDMTGMFAGAEAFNQPVNFDTSNVTNMHEMFREARVFNQPLNFNMSKVLNERLFMFMDADAFLRDKKAACDFYRNAVKNMASPWYRTLSETSIIGVVIGCK